MSESLKTLVKDKNGFKKTLKFYSLETIDLVHLKWKKAKTGESKGDYVHKM